MGRHMEYLLDRHKYNEDRISGIYKNIESDLNHIIQDATEMLDRVKRNNNICMNTFVSNNISTLLDIMELSNKIAILESQNGIIDIAKKDMDESNSQSIT